MAEEEGFEPPRALTPLPVFKTDPFSQAWVFLRKTINNISREKNKVNAFVKKNLKFFTERYEKPCKAVYKGVLVNEQMRYP